jgi:N-acetylmuramic acid 6-phosphate (MurNAc-6-P) etherase
VLGVKDADTYLPTDDEVKEMIAQGEAAMKSREPSPDDQAKLAKAKLDNTKADEIAANVQGNTAERQLEYMNVAQGKTAAGIN